MLEPLGEGSPIGKFIERNTDGGMHHICYEVDDIIAARDRLKDTGARVLGTGEPLPGASSKVEGSLAGLTAVGTQQGAMTLEDNRFFDRIAFEIGRAHV